MGVLQAREAAVRDQWPNMNSDLLLIFVRNAELGRVKTRLASALGDEQALDIYLKLLEHTASICGELDTDKKVCYSQSVETNDMWDDAIFAKAKQQGSDLGERMLGAFTAGFEQGHDKIVLIGSDCYELSENHIKAAFSALDSNRFVLGPAKDGGYYLIGMQHLRTDLFRDKKWGTSTVLNDTLGDLKGEDVFLLEELNDIDTIDDLREFPNLLTQTETND